MGLLGAQWEVVAPVRPRVAPALVGGHLMDDPPRTRVRLLGTAALLTLLSAVTTAVVVGDDDDADEAVTLAGPAAGAGPGWEVLPPSPLSPRHAAATVAVGDEVLVLGGTSQGICPPAASCVGPEPGELLVDAAAYDVVDGSWRTLSDVPDSSLIPVGVIGDVAYVGSRQGAFAYDVSDDSWTPVPPLPDRRQRGLAVAGDVLVSATFGGTGPDLLLDPSRGTWTTLPEAPLSAGSARLLCWTGDQLVLFDHESVPNPGAGANPWFTRYAALDLGSRTWGPAQVIRDALPQESIRWDGRRFLSMGGALETIDGGGPPPGDYGRSYPTSGYLDLETAAWSPLPPGRPPTTSFGVTPAFASSERYVSSNGEGSFLDTQEQSWVTSPAPPPEVGVQVNSAWVGDRLFAWGGGAPDAAQDGGQTLIATGAIWTPPAGI